MKWGLAVGVRQNLDEVLRVSEIAYHGGIDQIWVVDFPASQLASVAVTMLAKYVPMRLGIGLLSPLLYSPQQMIRMIQSIRDNYDIETDIMVGSGDPLWLSRVGLEYSSGLVAVRAVRDEVIEIMELLKKNELASQLLLAAQGPKMISIAQLGDGVLLNYSDPTMIQWAVKQMETMPEGYVKGVFPPTALADKTYRLPEYAKNAAAIVALGTSSKVLKRFGLLAELSGPKNDLNEKGELTAEIVNSIPEEILSRFILHCTPDDLNEYVSSLVSMGIDLIVFGPPLSSLEQGVEMLVSAKQKYSEGQ